MAQYPVFTDEAVTFTNDVKHATGTKVGFYGAAPIAIRATNSQHVTSNVAAYTNTSCSALLGAWAQEVTNTLLGLGIWTSP